MPRKLFSYNRFIGLDTVTSPSNMSERFLVELDGAHVDFRGQIVKGPHFKKPSLPNNNSESHYNVKHYGAEDHVRYVLKGIGFEDGSTSNTSIWARSYLGSVVQQNMFVSSATTPILPLSLVNFDQKQFAFMSGHDPYYYNGTAFTNAATGSNNQYSSINAYPKGGMAVNILNRLVVAGIPGRETEIHISVQDSFEDWRTNTSSGTTPNQTDGAIIDVKNQFTSKDVIKGLAVLEGDKLVVFGQNETLVYLADTNINLWEIARDFRVPIGIFGRNTAVNVGTDVFFCSRFGIHSLKRAASGLTLETMTFTREIEDFYQETMARVGVGSFSGPNQSPFREPQAVWDGAIGQYHVFIPINITGNKIKKITFTYDPEAGRSGHKSFSMTSEKNLTFKDQSCGSYFAVRDADPITSNLNSLPSLLVGTMEGYGDGRSFHVNEEMHVRTPLLSQGSPDTYKHYRRLIVRAVFDGDTSVPTANMTITIFDSEGNTIQNTLVNIERDSFLPTTGQQTGTNIDSTRPIDIPCRHRAKSISIRFTSQSTSPVKILDFALVVDTK